MSLFAEAQAEEKQEELLRPQPLVRREPPTGPLDLLAIAVERNLDTEKLRELVALEREWRADRAKAEYAAAMSRFGELKQVVAHNRTGRTAGNAPFSYSDFPAMVKAVTPWLAECGLSFSHRQDPPVVADGKISFITVYCQVKHNAGHHEEFSYPAMPDGRLEGKVSPSQLIQLSITYAKRQTLAMGLGLATAEDKDDDDSHSQRNATVTDSQVADLEALISETGANKAQFLKFMQVEALSDILASRYSKAIAALEQKRKASK